MVGKWTNQDQFKSIINQVIGYSTLDRPKSMKSDVKEVIEKIISVVWNNRRMSTDSILDPLIGFVVRVIAQKFFQSRKINTVSCMAIDLGYKIVKRDHTYDLIELQLQQLSKNS